MIRGLEDFWAWALVNRVWFGLAGLVVLILIVVSQVPHYLAGSRPGPLTEELKVLRPAEPPGQRKQVGDARPVGPVARPGTEDRQTLAKISSADCRMQEHRDTDFCQRVRMAAAAERQVRLGWIGLGLLLCILLAASLAAIAAWRTLDIVRDTARRLTPPR